jgi:Asp-tRNA(Asn)/Glu-tRNA(Gln) amidotransferase A subunit family amidase
MATFDLQTASVHDVQAAMDIGALSAEQLVRLLNARIDAYDKRVPAINSIITVNPAALDHARAADIERRHCGPRSLLHGIPVVVKDNYNTADMPTTGGSSALADNMTPDDAFAVKRLRDAGALIFAKTNLGELARNGTTLGSLLGQTRNPYDLTRTPGGSSGGTGAAIAAGFGLIGMGTDTIQSIRSPASANSAVGLRPTFGLISREGIIPWSYTQDTAGPITRCVADAAIMMDYMAGFDYQDPSTWQGIGRAPKTYTAFLDKRGLAAARLGVVTNLFGDGRHADHALVNAQTMKCVEALRALGATTIELDIPEVSATLSEPTLFEVLELEVKWTFDRYLAGLGPGARYHTLAEYVAAAADTLPSTYESLRVGLEKGDRIGRDPEYIARLGRQVAFRDALIAVMDRHGLDALFYTHQRRLVVPASADAVQLERNGFMASSTGLPAITVPGGFSPPTDSAPIGVPIGVEFLGRPFSEAQLFKLAYAFEQGTLFRRCPASTPALPGERFELCRSVT